MPQKVILSADSTCDLSAALIERYQVHMYPLHILLEGRQYADGEISRMHCMRPGGSASSCPKRARSHRGSM